jgi:hypothetical protein
LRFRFFCSLPCLFPLLLFRILFSFPAGSIP